jgi:hypothetical protein
MRCEKVSRHLPALVADQMDSREAVSVRKHLANCPDCAKSFEKTKSLRSLLSLKRHEKPDEFFLRNFVPEFRRRLCLEVIQKPSKWERMQELWAAFWTPSVFMRTVRYSAVVLVTLIIASVYFNRESSAPMVATHRASTTVSEESIVEVESSINQLAVANLQSGSKESVYVMDRIEYQPATHGSRIFTF